jgi:hypothetical protein
MNIFLRNDVKAPNKSHAEILTFISQGVIDNYNFAATTLKVVASLSNECHFSRNGKLHIRGLEDMMNS